MKDTFFITTAIDYTNAPPHIGHAYEKVLADVLARYRRLRGQRVFFLTGVDQHGQKVQQSAYKEGIPAREFAERNTEKFHALYHKLNISYDGWAATTDPRHVHAVRAILNSLYESGQIYKANYNGFYSVRQEQFLTDKERGPDGMFGSEWGEVIELAEENYYFKLEEHRDWLVCFLEEHTDFITPGFRAADALNAARKVTGDLCISRPKERLEWGIELPFDSRFVTYVWFDALINYLSFAGYRKVGGDASLPDAGKLWPADAHVIGKDILVPAHGIYWPIMLHAMGFPDDEMPRLLVHGWWNSRGEKMSKSTGNVVDPDVLVDKYGVEAVRYYLVREIVTGQDADFVEERLAGRYKADLANDLGNLLNRSLNMASRYRNGILTNVEAPEIIPIRELAESAVSAYARAMDGNLPHTGLEALWTLVNAGNALVETSAPWKLAKLTEDAAARTRLDAVLYALAEISRIVALLIAPVMPSASVAMLSQLNYAPPAGDRILLARWGGLSDQHVLGAPTPVFPRLEA